MRPTNVLPGHNPAGSSQGIAMLASGGRRFASDCPSRCVRVLVLRWDVAS